MTKSLAIDDRIEKMQEAEAYITVNDHKEGFLHKLSLRLINPSKSDIGKINKKLLDKTNEILILNTNVNRWKNTRTVIDWFKNVTNKKKCSFIQFDEKKFYPTISLNLFYESIQRASTITEISDSDKTIIKHSRKTLLFHNNQPWEKNSGDPDFDVPMGCYDGAEICESVRIFILNKVSNIIDQNSIGLYRDDGLGMFCKLSRPQIEHRMIKIIKIFKGCDLSITVTTNIASVYFLDSTLSSKTESYQPFKKPNNNPL